MTGGGDDSSSPYQGGYSWTARAAPPARRPSTAQTTRASPAPPASRPRLTRLPRAGGFVNYPDGYASGSVTITTDDGNDALSGVNAATGVIERD